jgi:hypothetical protein
MGKPSSSLRNEIQALRNQAKARGYSSDEIPAEQLEEKAFTRNESTIPTYTYVYRDLFRSLIFLIVALVILFGVSVKLSSIGQFSQIRSAIHVSQFSF